MPFDAQPVVEGLQRELEIGGGFDLDYSEAAATIAGEQVHDGAIAGGEGRGLSVDWMCEEARIDDREVGADDRFEPGFGPIAIQRVGGILRCFAPDSSDSSGEFEKFARARFGGGFGEAGALPSVDAKRGRSVWLSDGFETRELSELREVVRPDVGPGGMANRIEHSVDVAVVGGIEAHGVVFVVVSEDDEAGG